MANEISKIEGMITKVKSEIGKFLLNQSKLDAMSNQIERYKDVKPEVYKELKQNYDFLSDKQKKIESKAMDWIKRATDYKDKLLLDPDVQTYMTKKQIPDSIFSGSFWKKLNSVLNDIGKLSMEGINLSSSMITQNSDVELLQKSVAKGGIINIAGEDNLKSGLVWIYGLVGLGLSLLLVNYRKKRL